MIYHGVGGLRVGFMRRDGHEVDLDLTLRERAISEKREVRGKGISWMGRRTLKRNR